MFIVKSQEPKIDLYSNFIPKKCWNHFLMLYTLGLIISFCIYAYILEKLTSNKKGPDEFCLMFICCTIYTGISFLGKCLSKEKGSTAPSSRFLLLSCTTFISSFTSIRSLRHISYPAKILGKTCKPIPIMLIGLFMGKTYPKRKYFSVVLITLGASVFMYYNHGPSEKERKDSFWGLLLMSISLCFDGITGALEDRFMKNHFIGPFAMMHNINRCSMLLAFSIILATQKIHLLVQLLVQSPEYLILLGISGGMGQIFIFLTINKFGALVTSIVGTIRKIVTITGSIIIFGHVLKITQMAGLSFVFIGLIVNLIRIKTSPTSNRKINEPQEIELLGSIERTEISEIIQHHQNDEEKIEESKNIVMKRLRKMKVDQQLVQQEFPDMSEALFAEKDDQQYAIAIDAIFRATTAV